MSETTAQYLSRLHLSTGLVSDADVVERRAKAIESVAGKCTIEQAVIGASVAAGVASDFSKLQWLTTPISAADPTYAPVGIDKAAAIAASAFTNAVLAGSDKRSSAAALVVLSAGLSAARVTIVDDRLSAAAQRRLWAIQQIGGPQIKYSQPSASVVAEQIVALSTPLTQNNAPAAVEPLKVVVDGLLKADAAQGKAASEAVSAIITRQNLLEAEVQMLWWVVGKASHELLKPFADLPAYEAAARAAKELVGMFSPHRPSGPFAAPSLLERVLESSQKSRSAAQTLEKAMSGLAKEVRAALFVARPSASAAPAAFPIMLAAEFSLESNDEPDWKPRFTRTSHVDATHELTPVEFAKQLLREFLLWKMLSTS
ncbi:hypothetical protein AWB70_04161 [Caballeronia cordobensis]|uniref:GTPase-associated system helical domain-containing protein n=1 Tax=Caballeronia cordobensis TaxID=1353886 RepID=A0A158I3I7_CABCO|nr:GTPase-associated system all-helical protein GASH [Caballeronia cordobensis]SAL51144.1 hypothetical protein AWB70_04161 [Caballeronia cordobensis]